MAHIPPALPPHEVMLAAFLGCDAQYEGVFYTAVKTTGIFCRPTCPVRKPKPENVVFFATAEDCLAAGYRACKRCKPLALPDATPAWIAELLDAASADPRRQWSDAGLRERGIDTVGLRRWCKRHFGLTFHALVRARKIGAALQGLRAGERIDDVADDVGYASLSGFRDAVSTVTGTAAGRARALRPLHHARIDTPLGPMLAMASDRGLVMLEFLDRPILVDELDVLRERFGFVPVPGDTPLLKQARTELAEYFAGTRRDFDLPLELPGSEFQQAVWNGLRTIPYGTTASYGELAARIGNPKAARALGLANGQNRMSIIIPCHRVIGADGTLVGYGGGQARKRWLLRHEGAVFVEDGAVGDLFA